ncbi:MAG: phosphate ABC transporter permease subunit PstC [Gammaproteobacteria bacterium]
MPVSTVFLLLVGLGVLAFLAGKRKAVAIAGTGRGSSALNSLPGHYGLYTAIWCGLPALFLLFTWKVLEPTVVSEMVASGLPSEIRELPPERFSLVMNEIRNVVEGNVVAGSADDSVQAAADRYSELTRASSIARGIVAIALGVLGMALGWWLVSAGLKARNKVESVVKLALIACSSIAILTTLGIVLSVLFESLVFFSKVSFTEFLFGLNWSPQTAIRADQVGSGGAFGAVPLFVGTLLISTVAMALAVPVGLMIAIYLAEYASRKVRSVAKPLLEILAGIPTVVYGFFAALVVAPKIRGFGSALGLDVASESALAAGLVMGVMIIPFVSSLSDDVINAVPQAMRDGAYGLGATRSETIRNVIIPAALPGIVGGVLLAVSRAIGETMIVVMAAGLSANLTFNPLEAVTTVTVQIVTLLTGDQEFDSAKTLSAFALGLMLFVVTLTLNVIALRVVRKYREQYD